MRKLICIVTAFLIIIAMFSGCGVLQKLGLQKNNDELTPVSSVAINEEDAKKITDKMPVRLYFANSDNSKLFLEVRYVPVSEAKKSTGALAAAIIEELIKGPTKGNGLKATIPGGTKLLLPINIEASVATVNLSKELVDKHPGGKAAERMTIYSIVNSLTELVEVQKVEFLIDGKSREEFKGSFQFNMPFPRNAPLISKEPLKIVPASDKSKQTGSADGDDAKETGSLEEGEAKETNTYEGETEDVVTDEGEAEDVAADEGEAEDVITDEGEAEDVITDEGEAEDVITDEGGSEETYLEVLE